MARQTLGALALEFSRDRFGFARQHRHAVLLWAPPEAESDIIGKTLAPGAARPARRGETVVIEVVKSPANVFAFGVTVGHADSNDIVLPNERVSRFHAYIRQGPSGAALVDAESTNGTFLDGVRLTPNKPAPLLPAARISFGGETVTYLEPARLVAHLEELLARPTLE
ncbi:MAG: FHA domain-containing protein [Myxococcales bacterium]